MSNRAKRANSEATWALLTEGVSQARLETHRLRHLCNRAVELVGKSEEKDHLYEVAGDIIKGVPKRLDELERVLDRTSYALSVLGEDHLRDRLSLSDRRLVDDAVHGLVGPPNLRRSVDAVLARGRVANRYLMADLHPPLGFGDSCLLVDRIRNRVRDPRLREELVDDVERGFDLTNQQAAKIYDLDVERGVGKFRRVIITAHAQYRMDKRGITVNEVRLALASFYKRWMDLRSQHHGIAQSWERAMAYGEKIAWTDPKIRLTVVFLADGDSARLVTTYWEGLPDDAPPGEGGCDG